jgi:site-specific recombinase XerD
VARVLDKLRATGLSDATIETYRVRARRLEQRCAKDARLLSEATLGDVADLLAEDDLRGLAFATRELTYFALRAIGHTLKINVPDSLYPQPGLPRERSLPPGRHARIASPEGRVDTDTPQGLRDYAIALLMCDNRMSAEDVARLTLERLHLDEGKLALRGGDLRLSPDQLAALIAWIEAVPVEWRPLHGTWVFVSIHRQRLTRQGVWRALRRHGLHERRAA